MIVLKDDGVITKINSDEFVYAKIGSDGYTHVFFTPHNSPDMLRVLTTETITSLRDKHPEYCTISRGCVINFQRLIDVSIKDHTIKIATSAPVLPVVEVVGSRGGVSRLFRLLLAAGDLPDGADNR